MSIIYKFLGSGFIYFSIGSNFLDAQSFFKTKNEQASANKPQFAKKFDQKQFKLTF
jgi:hypothetical protein